MIQVTILRKRERHAFLSAGTGRRTGICPVDRVAAAVWKAWCGRSAFKRIPSIVAASACSFHCR
jgi:hypothetical protein